MRASSSRCSSAWRRGRSPPSPARSAMCCCTSRSSARTSSTSRSATSCGDWKRTPPQRTSSPPRSTWPTTRRCSNASATVSSHRPPVRPTELCTVDRTGRRTVPPTPARRRAAHAARAGAGASRDAGRRGTHAGRHRHRPVRRDATARPARTRTTSPKPPSNTPPRRSSSAARHSSRPRSTRRGSPRSARRARRASATPPTPTPPSPPTGPGRARSSVGSRRRLRETRRSPPHGSTTWPRWVGSSPG